MDWWVVVVRVVGFAEVDMTSWSSGTWMREFVPMTRMALVMMLGETHPEQSGGEVGTTCL